MEGQKSKRGGRGRKQQKLVKRNEKLWYQFHCKDGMGYKDKENEERRKQSD